MSYVHISIENIEMKKRLFDNYGFLTLKNSVFFLMSLLRLYPWVQRQNLSTEKDP